MFNRNTLHSLIIGLFLFGLVKGQAPNINMHPSDTVVTKGDTAFFLVNASGLDTLTYQWEYSTTSASWQSIVNATDSVYKFK